MRGKPDAPWMTPDEVADLCGGLSAQYIREEITTGKLPAVYIRYRSGRGGFYRIRRADALVYESQKLEQVMAPTTPARVTGPMLVTQLAQTSTAR